MAMLDLNQLMRKIIPVLLALIVLNGCTDTARTGYLELTGRVFIFNPRIAEATYVVTLGVLKQPPVGSRIEAVFDNPAGGAGLTIEQKLQPGQTRIVLESGPLQCIKKDKPYAFKVRLLSENGGELQVVDSSIRSTLDQSVMPDQPLVIGPGYDPNPALKGNSGGHILRQRECPT
jgi:hypothetical protein